MMLTWLLLFLYKAPTQHSRCTSYKMLRLLVLTVLAAAALATDFDQCDSGAPVPVALRVVNCEKQPCDFPRGEDISAQADFLADHNVANMKAQSIVEILGGVVEYPLPQPDGCQSLVNSACPLEEGDGATYQLTLPVLSEYPKVPLTTEISLIDTDSGSVVMCFRISGQVV
ncbi:NPC intracellular cholesterol transporter 2-like [Periplaneta americana]|uniref:NPC intracellular cholesterol transporter 2-like n=1 Tax=Periplaneta americana TaxID=6978 RepID=UPI0037E8726E